MLRADRSGGFTRARSTEPKIKASLHWKPLRPISSVPLEVCRGYGGTPGVSGVRVGSLTVPTTPGTPRLTGRKSPAPCTTKWSTDRGPLGTSRDPWGKRSGEERVRAIRADNGHPGPQGRTASYAFTGNRSSSAPMGVSSKEHYSHSVAMNREISGNLAISRSRYTLSSGT